MTGNERRDRGWVFLRGSLVFILHERVEGIIESVGQLATVVANKCHPMKIYQYMGGGGAGLVMRVVIMRVVTLTT